MGIPGVTRFFAHYREKREDKQGQRKHNGEETPGTAVVDGPALAYYAYELATLASKPKESGTGGLDVPYHKVTVAALDFLRELETRNIKIGKIYFDGSLPDRKREERRRRLNTTLSKLCYHREQKYLGPISLPFLVPSVLECLRMSEYSSFVKMVPGEADSWCVNHTWESSDIILFTNDSDILISELGPSSRVVLLREITHELHPFWPEDIAASLGLGKSLQSVAYSIATDGYNDTGNDFNKHVQHAQNIQRKKPAKFLQWQRAEFEALVDEIESRFNSFEKRLSGDPLQELDPRVSEIVIRLLGWVSKPNQPELHLTMYLPVLIEDFSFASAWCYSIANEIRALGYSLVNTLGDATVSEYIRKGNQVGINKVVLYSRELGVDQGKTLTTNLKTWMENNDALSATQQWRLFAADLVLSGTQADLKSRVIHDSVWRAVQGRIHPGNPDVQFKAHVDAILYSLRILAQCMNVFLHMNQDNESADSTVVQTFRDLSHILQTMPTIERLFPTSGRGPKSESVDHALEAAILKLHTEPEDPLPGSEPSGKKNRKSAKRKRQPSPEALGSLDPSNAFALLGLLEE